MPPQKGRQVRRDGRIVGVRQAAPGERRALALPRLLLPGHDGEEPIAYVLLDLGPGQLGAQ